MHLRLGLMSLARLALEVVDQLVASNKLDRREVEQLPKRLVDMIIALWLRSLRKWEIGKISASGLIFFSLIVSDINI